MIVRSVFWFLGALSLTLGIIGIFLPVLPTTPFVLLTAVCWAKASPRLHNRLLAHRYFGPMVRNWEERRAIPRRAKYLAYSMMTLSCVFLFVQFPERRWVAVLTAIICTATALWMHRLPEK